MKTRLKTEGDAVYLQYERYDSYEGKRRWFDKLLTENVKKDGEIFLDENGYPCFKLEPLIPKGGCSPLGEKPMSILDKCMLEISVVQQIMRMEGLDQWHPLSVAATNILADATKYLADITQRRAFSHTRPKPQPGDVLHTCLKCHRPVTRQFGYPGSCCC